MPCPQRRHRRRGYGTLSTPSGNEENPEEGRFVRRRNPEVVLDFSSKESRSSDKRERNVDLVLARIRLLFEDAEKLASMRLENFQNDWVARRAAKNIVAENGEAVGRPPSS